MTRPTPDWLRFAAAASAVAASGAAAAPEPGGPVSAWIAAEPAGTGQVFTGYVKADRAIEGRYELVAERSGPAGRSTTRQGGAVRAEKGAVVQLSRASLGPIGPEDRYSVVLTVFENDEPVAYDERRR